MGSAGGWKADFRQLCVAAFGVEERQLGGNLDAASTVENLARAERAEYREERHKEKWAAEVDKLRQEVQRLRPALIEL